MNTLKAALREYIGSNEDLKDGPWNLIIKFNFFRQSYFDY